jgi:hypothetical protein
VYLQQSGATATGTVMIQKFTETLAQTIERSHAEATAANGWLVIHKNDGHIFLISDDTVQCHPDSVEFTDDNEGRIVLPYEQIFLVEVGKG